MKLALILACVCMTGSSATIVWAVNKQPGPQIMCPMKVKPNMRGYWRTDLRTDAERATQDGLTQWS